MCVVVEIGCNMINDSVRQTKNRIAPHILNTVQRALRCERTSRLTTRSDASTLLFTIDDVESR